MLSRVEKGKKILAVDIGAEVSIQGRSFCQSISGSTWCHKQFFKIFFRYGLLYEG